MQHLLLVFAAINASASAAPAAEVHGPHLMTPAEIRAYNARLTRDDPAFIRCKREEETGSLVRVRTTCRTNAHWQRIEGMHNDTAREIVDRVETANGNP